MTTENEAAAAQEVTEAKKPVKTKAAAQEVTEAKKPVDKETYDRFTALKFLQFSFQDSDQRLEEKDKKELESLEKELKSCDGAKPIRTQRAAISNEQVLIVEGIPLPSEYLEIIQKSKNPAYYLGE